MSRFLLASAALACLGASILSGCLVPSSNPAPSSGTPGAPEAQLLATLAAIPPVEKYDRTKAVDWWESFVTTYNHREWGFPQNAEAAAYLESELKASGFQAETLTYKVPYPTSSSPVTGDFKVVRGLKAGVGNASHRLVLVAHYDVVTQTPQGAYDDGSGAAVEMEICKLLAKVPTNKTIECVFFDGEEKGLVASAAYTADYAKGGKDWTWDQAFGYDMTGLNWPGYTAWKLYAMIGTDTEKLGEFTSSHQSFLNTTIYGFLGQRLNATSEHVEVLPIHDRNSDEQNFKRAGIPVVRFAGGRRAADYPMYHQAGDVTSYVYSYACGLCSDLAKGKETFAKGVEMVVLTSYYSIMAYDKYDPKNLPF